MDYSTSETVIGRWIDGKKLYRKIVPISTFPNKALKNTPHGISNILLITKYDVIGKRSDDITFIPLAYTGGTLTTYIEGANIVISSTLDYSMYTSGFAVLEYTKTTD